MIIRRLPSKIFLIILLTLNLSLSVVYADQEFINRTDVQEYIQSLVNQYHFNQQALIHIFSQVKIRPQIIRHINKPLEKEPWRLYQMLFVNEWRITHGVEFWNKYANALEKAEKIYGVPASIIVATIGIETRYGSKNRRISSY